MSAAKDYGRAYDRLKAANCFDCRRECPNAGGWFLACRDWTPASAIQMRPRLRQPDPASAYPIQ